jgi:hypothetical protein
MHGFSSATAVVGAVIRRVREVSRDGSFVYFDLTCDWPNCARFDRTEQSCALQTDQIIRSISKSTNNREPIIHPARQPSRGAIVSSLPPREKTEQNKNGAQQRKLNCAECIIQN